MLFGRNIGLASLLALSSLSVCAPAAYAAEQAAAAATAANVSAPAAERTVMAKVNAMPIYADEVQRAKKVMLSAQPNMQIPADRQKDLEKQAVNQLISAELLYQAGRKLEVKDLEVQVSDKISQSRSRFAKQEDFDKAIKALDMTESELREYTRRDLIISNFIQQKIASAVTVSEDESKKFYEQNLDKFKQGDSVRASHILIGVEQNATAADKQKAREKALKLRNDLAAGADFATLAKDNSTCPSSQKGGDLGYFGKGQMVQPFEQAAFALKPGEVSDVVETQFGYHIIKVIDSKKASTVDFKEVKPRIEEYLKGQKISAAIAKYIEDARKAATVEIYLK